MRKVERTSPLLLTVHRARKEAQERVAQLQVEQETHLQLVQHKVLMVAQVE